MAELSLECNVDLSLRGYPGYITITIANAQLRFRSSGEYQRFLAPLVDGFQKVVDLEKQQDQDI